MRNGINISQLVYPEDEEKLLPSDISSNINEIDKYKTQYLYANFIQNEGNSTIEINGIVQSFKQLINIVKNIAYIFYIIKDGQRFKCDKYIDYTENVNAGQIFFSFIIKENGNIYFKKILLESNDGENISSIIYNESIVENLNNRIIELNENNNDIQYPSAKTIYEFTNNLINETAVYYITKNAMGDPFATKAELDSATTFYSGGIIRVPTRNDYCIVKNDESHNNSSCRYTRQGTTWQFQIEYEKKYTEAQNKVINSGITSEKISKYDNKIISLEIPEMLLKNMKIIQQENDITNNVVNLVKSKRQKLPLLGVSGTNYGVQSNLCTGIKYLWYGEETEKPDISIQSLYKNTIFITPESL